MLTGPGPPKVLCLHTPHVTIQRRVIGLIDDESPQLCLHSDWVDSILNSKENMDTVEFVTIHHAIVIRSTYPKQISNRRFPAELQQRISSLVVQNVRQSISCQLRCGTGLGLGAYALQRCCVPALLKTENPGLRRIIYSAEILIWAVSIIKQFQQRISPISAIEHTTLFKTRRDSTASFPVSRNAYLVAETLNPQKYFNNFCSR